MYLSSNYMELMWSFPVLFHILVPPPVLLLVQEDQPSSSPCSSRRPSLTLLVNLICMSSFRLYLPCHRAKTLCTWYHDHSCYLSFSLHGTMSSLGNCLIHLYNPSPEPSMHGHVSTSEWMDGWIDDIWAGLWASWGERQLRMGQVGGYLTSRRAFWAAQYQARLTREASFWSDRGRKLRIYVSIWGKKTGHWGC